MENSEIRWTISVPITKNPDWMQVIILACASPLLVIALMVFMGEVQDPTLVIFVMFICIVILPLGVMFAFRVLGWNYEVEYILDHMGAINRFTLNQAKKNHEITKAAALVGVAGKMAGKTNARLPLYKLTAGKDRQDDLGSILWEKVKRVEYKENKRIIYLERGFGRGFSLFCNEDNYALVESMVKAHTA